MSNDRLSNGVQPTSAVVKWVGNGIPIPIEDMRPPVELDGSRGRFRCTESCEIEAQTDVEATKFWIAASKTEATTTSRRTTADKLLNWAYLERGKALSSFERSDFTAFMRFLAAPMPVARWVGARGARRGSATWRPFTGQLSAKSLWTTRAIVRSLAHYLTLNRYANLSIDEGYRSLEHGMADCAATAYKSSSLQHLSFLSMEEWHWIRRALDQVEDDRSAIERRLLAELLAYGSLHMRQIQQMTLLDVFEPTPLVPHWMLRVRGRAAWRGGEYLIAVPPLSITLARWLKEGVGQWGESNEYHATTPLIAITSSRAYRLVRKICREAADLAEAQRSLVAQKLMERNLLSLRQMLATPSSLQLLERYLETPDPVGPNRDEAMRLMKSAHVDWKNIESYWAPLSPLAENVYVGVAVSSMTSGPGVV